ncbi:OmpA family protein [Pseudonocardia sp. CA-107938]|uniref:OmpA family protein n=1 Tax=Pseudonocardia sp. CA-107938 TaxID=3240021 RepID=UPI003D8DEF2A
MTIVFQAGDKIMIDGRRIVAAVAALALLALPACGRGEQGRATSAGALAAPGTAAPSAKSGSGTANAVATSTKVRADNLRLVRSGNADIALQFEFVNTGTDAVTPSSLGMDPSTHVIAFLVDLPRGTGYAVQRSTQANPDIDFSKPEQARASASTTKDVPGGGSSTVTLVYPAPPAETASMLVLVDGFVPTEVPVQPAGSPSLKDDPVLHQSNVPFDDLFQPVQPLVCPVEGAAKPSGPVGPSSFRLPSDALFAFGKADLSPAASGAIDALAKQVTAKSGTVTIEGHTDSIGGDAENQKLSEARAAAAQKALADKLGSGFTYRTVGFGETRPVAPNTKPDGSDDPDGRAQNRRVEITVDAAAAAAPEPPPARDEPDVSLDGSGLQPKVQSVTALAGYTVAQVAITNGGSAAKDLGYLNDPNRNGVNGIRADTGGELSINLTSGSQLRGCLFTPSWWGVLENGSGADRIPAGGTLVQWAVFGPVPPDQKSVTVGVGGFATPFPARVASR